MHRIAPITPSAKGLTVALQRLLHDRKFAALSHFLLT